MIDVGAATVMANRWRQSAVERSRQIDGRGRSTRCPVTKEAVQRAQALDQFGSRVKAVTRSSAQGHPSATRNVVRRAERTSRPAACKRV